MDLDYFVQWGGLPWRRAVDKGLRELRARKNLAGASVLELGTRTGRMAIYFSLQGAHVLGVDLRPLEDAVAEARRWQSSARFMQYDGDLEKVSGTFDIVFTKSVFAGFTQDVRPTIAALHKKLNDGGILLSVENARSGPLLRFVRRAWHKLNSPWDCSHARYFSTQDVDFIRRIFSSVSVWRYLFPPIILVLAVK